MRLKKPEALIPFVLYWIENNSVKIKLQIF